MYLARIQVFSAFCVVSSWAWYVTASALPYPQGTAFPFMMYEVNSSAAVTNVTAYGWNVIQDYGNTTNSIINSYLAMAASNGLSGDVHIPCYGDSSSNFLEWPQSQVQAWIQGSMAKNNIGWWDMPEEMRSWKPTEVQLLKDYRYWVQLYDTNGQRPTYEYTPNNRIPSTQLGVVSNVDIVGTSCYCEAAGQPHAWVRYKVAESGVHAVTLAGATIGSNYFAGQKTVVAVLYCATNSSAVNATPQQCYHDVWSAIASGAQGIAVFAYWHAINDHPNLTNNLNQINLGASQITGSEMGQVILYGTQNTNVSFIVTSGPTNTDSFNPGDGTNWQYSSINVLCKSWSTNVYVVAVNSTASNVTANVTNLPTVAGTATAMFESRTVPVSNGGLSDNFAPWGVHIYKLAGTGAQSVISSISVTGGKVVLGCFGVGRTNYVLQYSTNFGSASGWIDAATNAASASGTFAFTNSLQGGAVFYRLVAQ